MRRETPNGCARSSGPTSPLPQQWGMTGRPHGPIRSAILAGSAPRGTNTPGTGATRLGVKVGVPREGKNRPGRPWPITSQPCGYRAEHPGNVPARSESRCVTTSPGAFSSGTPKGTDRGKETRPEQSGKPSSLLGRLVIPCHAAAVHCPDTGVCADAAKSGRWCVEMKGNGHSRRNGIPPPILPPGRCQGLFCVTHGGSLMDGPLYCPDCGAKTLEMIERTDPDAGGEFKETRTCDSCRNMIYVFRQVPDHRPPGAEELEAELDRRIAEIAKFL